MNKHLKTFVSYLCLIIHLFFRRKLMLYMTLCKNMKKLYLKTIFFNLVKETLKQKRGTAIKTKFAPSYSIRFMADLEGEIVRKTEFKPHTWWRYIDDIFFLWQYGEGKPNSFILNINKMHPSIKFTADSSKASINFLDVTVSIAEGTIETDLYFKPSDSHQYLLSSCCHTFYCKKDIRYNH